MRKREMTVTPERVALLRSVLDRWHWQVGRAEKTGRYEHQPITHAWLVREHAGLANAIREVGEMAAALPESR